MLLKPIVSDATQLITHDGYTYTLKGWSKFLGIPYDTLRMRYRRGLTGDELFKQVRPKEHLDTAEPNALSVEYEGETHSLAEWARIMGIPVGRLYNRHRMGKRGDDLFTPARQYTRSS